MLGLLGAGWGAAAALSSGLARQLRFKAKASGRSLSRTYNNRRPKRMGLKAGHGELVEEQVPLRAVPALGPPSSSLYETS